MILKSFPASREDSAVYQLTEPYVVVDPRPNGYESRFKFNVTVEGTAMTVTRIGTVDRLEHERPGWCSITFRVYSSNEFRYSFKSSKYLVHGLKHERAPLGTTEVIIKDGVKTINPWVFYNCKSLVKVTIPNSVLKISHRAFWNCASLRHIQLPSNLRYIGWRAFEGCSSLMEIYIPPTVQYIGHKAFVRCKSLKIVNITDNIEHIGYDIVKQCDNLLNSEIKERAYRDEDKIPVLNWLRNRYNPLHNLCWDPFVSPLAIQQYIKQDQNNEQRCKTNDRPHFTPLHLLAANPSVTAQMITTYLQLAPDVALMQDNMGQTPLHIICSVPYFTDDKGGAIRAFLGCSEGKKAAFVKSHEGRTPFECLCEKTFDELSFLEGGGIGDLTVWWYDCLGINLFAEDANVTRAMLGFYK